MDESAGLVGVTAVDGGVALPDAERGQDGAAPLAFDFQGEGGVERQYGEDDPDDAGGGLPPGVAGVFENQAAEASRSRVWMPAPEVAEGDSPAFACCAGLSRETSALAARVLL